MAVDLRCLQPNDFYRKFLEHQIRPDGRSLNKIRPTAINIGSITTAEGSAVVKLGNTGVTCGIKAELGIPGPNEANTNCGYIVPNVELPPLCSSRFRPGPPSEQAQAVSQLVSEVISKSNCISLSSLNIPETKYVWVLYCDLICLNYDGNLLDACLIALMAALKNVMLPTITLDPKTGDIEATQKEKLPIEVAFHPVCTTFALFDEDVIMIDPNAEEETVMSSVLSIAVTEDDKICTLYKPGGSHIDEVKLMKCIELAKIRGEEVRRLIDDAVISLHQTNKRKK